MMRVSECTFFRVVPLQTVVSARPHMLILLLVVTTMCSMTACSDEANFVQEGKASFYADELEGQPTASGEPFSQEKLTAAHRHLPLGTTATVLHNETGNSVTVRINDRGPHTEERIIDLSKGALQELGVSTDRGVIEVTVKAHLEPGQADELRSKLDDLK